MLVRFIVENFKSFDERQELSMITSSKVQANMNHKLKIKQVNILKNAVVYGANASGKSNMFLFFDFFKATLLEGLPINSINDFCKTKEENESRESVFEIQFTVGDSFYAYGFSAVLSKRIITEEWLFELMQDGSAKQLFIREGKNVPVLGETIKLGTSEGNRFNIYADDFAGNENRLFLSEMNRGKKYEGDSKLIFFKETFEWLVNNIIILNPNMALSNANNYGSDQSLEHISELIRTFDTGITNIKTKEISLEELNKKIPVEILNDIFMKLKQQLQMGEQNEINLSWRLEREFINVKLRRNEEPIITTLILKHGESFFDFGFSEESDGTRRLFDLIDMLLTNREDTLYVVDEIERSLHPKLTEHFLKLFMEAHSDQRVQLLFTTHEDSIMDQDLFRRDEIWFVERNGENASAIFSLDKFKTRYDTKLSKAYLDGRYGAIPVFKKFSFKKED